MALRETWKETNRVRPGFELKPKVFAELFCIDDSLANDFVGKLGCSAFGFAIDNVILFGLNVFNCATDRMLLEVMDNPRNFSYLWESVSVSLEIFLSQSRGHHLRHDE